MPWTAALFALGAVAIAGLPPLNGFVSEWLVYLGLFGSMTSRGPHGWASVPAAILLGMTGALALACFVKAYGVVFLGLPRESVNAHECGSWMRVPMLILATVCVAVGLMPALFWPLLSDAAHAWQPAWDKLPAPSSLVTLGVVHVCLAAGVALTAVGLWTLVRRSGVERRVTWDCGYAAPSPRMQYTAGSFASTIVSWFAWILRPEKHERPVEGSFPRTATFAQHVPETVLDRIVVPAGRGVMGAARLARRLQHGRLQAYVLYVLIGVLAISLLAVMGGSR
jgi:hydrogenase-4 component B